MVLLQGPTGWRFLMSEVPLYRCVFKRTPLGPYRRPMPRVLWGSKGGGAVSYEQATPEGRTAWQVVTIRVLSPASGDTDGAIA